MSPPTNGATSLAFQFQPMAAVGLPDALLYPLDGFYDDEFFATAPPPPPPCADPNRFLLLPSSASCNAVDVHGSGSSSSAPKGLAVAAPTSSVVTATVANSAPPSPSLPLMPHVGQRTSCFRGVTRYTHARRRLSAA